MIGRATFLALVALIASFAVSPSASAEPAIIGFELQAPSGLTVGDHFRFVIQLEAEAGSQITLASGALPAELSLTSLPKIAVKQLTGGRSAITIELQVAAFVPGQIEIPPLRLSFTEPSGAAGELLTPASVIEIASVLPSSGQIEPRDLKPQANLGSSTSPAPVLISFAVILAALAILVVMRRNLRFAKRRSESLAESFSPEELEPEDQARAILDQAGLEFLDAHDYGAYYAAIAQAIRNYLTERYGFPAFALTTGELDHEMQRRGIDRWQTRLVNGLLSQCDTSVYAHYSPALERADADLNSAYEIIEISRPAPSPEDEVPVA